MTSILNGIKKRLAVTFAPGRAHSVRVKNKKNSHPGERHAATTIIRRLR
jgi:hypothetical protein